MTGTTSIAGQTLAAHCDDALIDESIRRVVAAHRAADTELHDAVQQMLAVVPRDGHDTTVAQAAARARLARAAAAFWPGGVR